MTPTTEKPEAKSESKPETKPETKPAAAPGAKSDAQKNLKSIPMEELQKKLGSSPDGLSQDEAKKRLAQYGPNEIAEKKENPYLKFLTYFWGPIPWMIEGAVILSAAVRHWPDFFIILLLLLSNAVVGFWEEHQAGNAIAALRKQLAIKAKVKRDGKWTDPSAKELVPGDVIRLKLGDIVPADARLLPGDPVEVDQSALTGESLPADKKAGRCGIFRIHHSPGRKRRNGLCNRYGHLLRQDRANGAGAGIHQPFPESCAEDRRLPDHPRSSPGGVDHHRRAVPSRSGHEHAGVCAGPSGGRDSSGDAHRLVGDHGSGRTPSGEKTSHYHQALGDRRTGRRGHPVLGQDRHSDPEQADIRRSIHAEWYSRRSSHSLGRTRFACRRQGHHRPGGDRRRQGSEDSEGLPGAPFSALRSGPQAHRSHGERRGRQAVLCGQRRPTGNSPDVHQCR